MRRADRLFDIIQLLRTASRPLTAAHLAQALEVNQRTIYRDIAALQASRLPIEGAAGIGYVLRDGYDLPPLALNAEERHAVAVGAELLRRTGDPGLHAAALRVLSKLAVNESGCSTSEQSFFVSPVGARQPDELRLGDVRAAIRERRKLLLSYGDVAGRISERIVWPIGMAYYVQVTLIACWCESRADFRHFRTDRIHRLTVLPDRYADDDGELLARWRQLPKFGAAHRGDGLRDASPPHQ